MVKKPLDLKGNGLYSVVKLMQLLFTIMGLFIKQNEK